MLSDAEVSQDLDHVGLPIGIDPTGSGLTRGDLLVLYLAWLTDIALQALADVHKSGGLSAAISGSQIRGVSRRFAIPCFAAAVDETMTSRARAAWAEGVLSRAISRAQVVADTLTGQWNALTVDRVKAVLNAARDLDLSQLPKVLATTAAVREPIAAGASLFNEELEPSQTGDEPPTLGRKYLLVIDAGAGTTDFALFQVFLSAKHGANRYALINSTVRMSRIAGNAVDEVLRPLVLKACGIDPATGSPRSDADFALIKTDLASQIRSIKETLFREGRHSVSLLPNVKGTIELSELIDDPNYKDLGGELKTACRAFLEGLFAKEFIERLRVREQIMPIHVLLTGGSSSLPIIRDLGDTTLSVDGARFGLQRVKETPDWVNALPRELADLVAATYPQCAVAIGGSAPELPEELGDLSTAIVPPPPGTRILERYQVTGVG
jgi:molecular chaperone HscA